MRAKIAGLPTPARLMLGLLTVAMMGFFGMTFLEDLPVVGYGLLGFAALRLLLWFREVQIRLRRDDESEDEPEGER